MTTSWRLSVTRTLFPTSPREFSHRRSVRIALRTTHILATGVFLGGHIFGADAGRIEPWLWFSIISGLLLFATDLHASFTTLFEVHGVMVILKILLLIAVPMFWEYRVELLITILVIGSISSHMPGRYRHRLVLFSDRLAPYQRRARR
jgi:hypothetical protein